MGKNIMKSIMKEQAFRYALYLWFETQFHRHRKLHGKLSFADVTDKDKGQMYETGQRVIAEGLVIKLPIQNDKRKASFAINRQRDWPVYGALIKRPTRVFKRMNKKWAM